MLTIGFGPHCVPPKHYGFSANQVQPSYGFVANQSKPRYVFGANQAKTHYSFSSSYSDIYHPLPPIDFNTDILVTLWKANETIPVGIPYSVPEKTLLNLCQDLMIAVCNCQQNMPIPNRHLLFISDKNITCITELL